MRHFAIAALCFLAPTAAVASQCGSLTFGSLYWPMWYLRWGTVLVRGHHVEFLPYGRGVAAVVIIDATLPHPTLCIETVSAGSVCSSLHVVGWAWKVSGRFPSQVDITLAGMLDGVPWRGPLRDVRADPIGFHLHPGVPVRQDAGYLGTQLGLLTYDLAGGWSGIPDMQAFLVVPESGSW